LAISKSLVDLMGGNIWVDSQPEIGSTFYFTLPFIKTAIPVAKSDTQFEFNEVMDKLKGKRILIAEDDANSLFYLKTVLQNAGIVCFEALNGRDAVNLFLKNPDVDLILMDLKMPELSGFEAIKEIRRVSPKVPIIVQTAHVFNDEKVLCSAMGCNNFISKPVDVNVLFGALIQLIGEK